MDLGRVITVDEHVPTPIPYADYECLNLQALRWRPFGERLKYALLSILVLKWCTLGSFEPTKHAFHTVLLLVDCAIGAVAGAGAGAVVECAA